MSPETSRKPNEICSRRVITDTYNVLTVSCHSNITQSKPMPDKPARTSHTEGDDAKRRGKTAAGTGGCAQQRYRRSETRRQGHCRKTLIHADARINVGAPFDHGAVTRVAAERPPFVAGIFFLN